MMKKNPNKYSGKSDMKKKNLISIVICVACFFIGCNGVKSKHSEPVLSSSSPLYDDISNTFSISVMADSTDGASLTFYLKERGNVIQENHDGKFSGIKPLDEGYDVEVNIQWQDTAIVSSIHVVDFVVPDEPVDKMSADEMEKLINAHDRSSRQIIYSHITQGLKIVVTDSNVPKPQILSDVFTLLVNEVWQSVKVEELEFNPFNLISSITLRPVYKTETD
jgi:hypothetical protein